METGTVRDDGTLLQKKSDAVFKNSLVVQQICSFTSGADLLSLRAVSHTFHRDATMQLKLGHKPIGLLQDSSVDKFLALMRTRLNPEDFNSFPFSVFQLDLRNSLESFERFAAETGQHVGRLLFEPSDYDNRSVLELERRVISLLCRAPNLTQINLNTRIALHVGNSDLVNFPKSFPRLNCIGINYKFPSNPDSVSPDSVNLMSLLISRAPRLKEVKHVHVQDRDVGNDEGISILRDLVQHHPHRVPIIDQGWLRLKGEIPVLQEMRNMNLRFRNLHAELLANEDPFQRNFWDFLTTQSSCLQSLTISLWRQTNLTLAIPTLTALKKFSFWYGWNAEMTLAIPLAANQFPALQVFELIQEDNIVTFGTNPQPSVQEFDFSYVHALMELNPWHRLFPNLRKLVLNFGGITEDSYDSQNLAFTLNHFPFITNLELRSDCRLPNAHEDLWDILTGESPRPVSTEMLLHGILEQDPNEPEDPVDGVYQTPSLGNLRALQTLKCRPGNRSNLNAILYMTRIGRLQPLNELVLIGLTEDLMMEVEEETSYYDLFAQFHGTVCLVGQEEE